MTSRGVQCVLTAIVVAVVAGCGSGDAPTPSQAFGPTYAEGVIEKKVGEPAGLNCPDDSDKPCEATERPGPDQQFLRFDVEAFSSNKTFEFPDSADALLLRNWSVDGADGTMHDLVADPACGDGTAPIGEPVVAGTRVHARFVVRAPKPAERLRLSWLELRWEWPVPGSD
jgi:hypothetical protein